MCTAVGDVTDSCRSTDVTEDDRTRLSVHKIYSSKGGPGRTFGFALRDRQTGRSLEVCIPAWLRPTIITP